MGLERPTARGGDGVVAVRRGGVRPLITAVYANDPLAFLLAADTATDHCPNAYYLSQTTRIRYGFAVQQ